MIVIQESVFREIDDYKLSYCLLSKPHEYPCFETLEIRYTTSDVVSYEGHTGSGLACGYKKR